MKNLIYVLCLSLVVVSCKKTQFEPRELTEGSADFSRYISVGNSLTQGFQDNGLYEKTQKNSYPALIAKQMARVNVGMDEFVQPVAFGNGSGYMHLEYYANDFHVIAPGDSLGEDYVEDPSWSSWDALVKGGRYTNYGVSGIRLTDCVALNPLEKFLQFAITSFNPYGRFLDWGSIFSPRSYLDILREENHTFFSCWMGNNDVLGYATNGGVSGLTSQMTDAAVFEQKYDSLLKVLTQNGAKGICANIPDVTSIPLISTVRASDFDTDIYIEQNDNSVRKATNEDLMLLTALDEIDNGAGTQSNPLKNKFVLDKDEVVTVQTRTNEINAKIKALADKYKLAFLDANALLRTFDPGIKVDGIEFTVKFIEGGLFSLDGVHLNQRGYAHLANQFIKEINAHYGSNILLVDITKYRGITFPNK